MSEIDIITPDLIKDAKYVSDAWRTASQSRLEGICETGRRLIEIRSKYQDADGNWKKEDEGKWSRLVGANQWEGQSLLPFAKSQTFALIRVAGNERLFRHVGILPDGNENDFNGVYLIAEIYRRLRAAERDKPRPETYSSAPTVAV